MKIINNITGKLSDDLQVEISSHSKVSIAAACFSVYAYEELKEQLEQVDSLRFIFTSPTFLAEQAKKEKREFYIPRQRREKIYMAVSLRFAYETSLHKKLSLGNVLTGCAAKHSLNPTVLMRSCQVFLL